MMNRREEEELTKRAILFLFVVAVIYLFSSLVSCHTEPELIPIGDARVIGVTEDGNYIVTPAFVVMFGDLKAENELLKLEVKKLRAIIEKDK